MPRRMKARKPAARSSTPKNLNIFERHQWRIAHDTLRMSDVGAGIMGGMTKAEAREIIARLRAKGR